MAIPCNAKGCTRSGRWALKLTFRQAAPPGWTPEKGKPRVGLTVETEGLYCDAHKALKVEQYADLPVRLQVDAWFYARGLGACAHAETQAAWQLVNDPNDPEALDATPKQAVKM